MTTANKHFVRSDTLEDSAPALASVTPFPRASDAGVDVGPGAQVARGIRGWRMKALIAALLAVDRRCRRLDRDARAGGGARRRGRRRRRSSWRRSTSRRLRMQTLSRSLPLSGSMSPIVQATLKSKVGGEVELVPLREGQDVREGEVIARIDTRNLQAQYDRAARGGREARAPICDLATLNRDKNRTLLEQHYISQNTYEADRERLRRQVASLKLAEADARLAKINLDDAVIRAPFSGTIAKRHVQPGEKVSPDSAIVTLVDLRQMVLEAAVPAAEIPAVQHRSDGALQGRRVRRARVRRRGAADQSDDRRRLARHHDLHRRAESEPAR